LLYTAAGLLASECLAVAKSALSATLNAKAVVRAFKSGERKWGRKRLLSDLSTKQAIT
jgi:hypothetical protein